MTKCVRLKLFCGFCLLNCIKKVLLYSGSSSTVKCTFKAYLYVWWSLLTELGSQFLPFILSYLLRPSLSLKYIYAYIYLHIYTCIYIYICMFAMHAMHLELEREHRHMPWPSYSTPTHLREMNTYAHENICTRMFKVALFMITQNWKKNLISINNKMDKS